MYFEGIKSFFASFRHDVSIENKSNSHKNNNNKDHIISEKIARKNK
jgi:hypothetical protein